MSYKQITYDDVHAGMELPSLEIGPWTVAHIVRWCAAQENWERQHIDLKYATTHEGLPDVVANGNWRKHVMARLLKDWASRGGWLWRLFMRYSGMQFPGDIFDVWGTVTSKREFEGLGFIEIRGGMRNQEGRETTPTSAVVVLPLEGGNKVPYPFVPPQGLEWENPFQKGTTCRDPKYVTDEVRAHIGREHEELESWDEVCRSELRRFSQAIPDPDPIYWDEELARQTRFGGIVAPPLFPVDAFRTPPYMPDRLTEKLKEDPDFWGGPPGDARFASSNREPLPLHTTVSSTLNGGQDFEILELARLGEKLRVGNRLTDVYEKSSSTFGRIVILESTSTYRNSEGRVILRMLGRGIRR
jgi:acyl dehydratase